MATETVNYQITVMEIGIKNTELGPKILAKFGKNADFGEFFEVIHKSILGAIDGVLPRKKKVYSETYLHKQGVAHGDLTCSNIIWSQKFELKLIDSRNRPKGYEIGFANDLYELKNSIIPYLA